MARLKTNTVEVDGVEIPPELFDVDDPTWATFADWAEWMEARGFDMDSVLTTIDHPPARRRNFAAEAWGAAEGVVTKYGVDCHRIREMGIYGTP